MFKKLTIEIKFHKAKLNQNWIKWYMYYVMVCEVYVSSSSLQIILKYLRLDMIISLIF